jgi:hypothetical protein
MNNHIVPEQWLSWSGLLLSSFFVLALTFGYLQ